MSWETLNPQITPLEGHSPPPLEDCDDYQVRGDLFVFVDHRQHGRVCSVQEAFGEERLSLEHVHSLVKTFFDNSLSPPVYHAHWKCLCSLPLPACQNDFVLRDVCSPHLLITQCLTLALTRPLWDYPLSRSITLKEALLTFLINMTWFSFRCGIKETFESFYKVYTCPRGWWNKRTLRLFFDLVTPTFFPPSPLCPHTTYCLRNQQMGTLTAFAQGLTNKSPQQVIHELSLSLPTRPAFAKGSVGEITKFNIFGQDFVLSESLISRNVVSFMVRQECELLYDFNSGVAYFLGSQLIVQYLTELLVKLADEWGIQSWDCKVII
ncbi:uncharacterized protein LOC115228170 [Octopus sinensis]|nr:uncharacterized protein LOC115228170 [Octopus sinensis]